MMHGFFCHSLQIEYRETLYLGTEIISQNCNSSLLTKQLHMRKSIGLCLILTFFGVNKGWAQQRDVTGKVADLNGVPVSGATIKIKNQKSKYCYNKLIRLFLGN